MPSNSNVKQNKSFFWISLYLLSINIFIPHSGCSVISDSSIKAGLGAQCNSDADCHAAKCVGASDDLNVSTKICSVACGSDLDCPQPAICAEERCQLPLNVGMMLIGSINDLEGWTYTHIQGLNAASSALGYVKLKVASDVKLDQADEQLERLAATSQVILANSIDYGKNVLAAAARHPEVKFLWVGDGVQTYGSANATSYWLRLEQAWYVAGQIAATMGKKRIGIISALVNPETDPTRLG